MKVSDIDDLVEPLKAGLDEFIKEMTFRPLCDLYDKDKVRKQNYNGLYLIEVSTKGHKDLNDWINYFVGVWDRDDFSKSFTSTTKIRRIRKHSKLKKWMPMYLGKSSNVASRLLQHIELPKEKRTFALKFEARNNIQGIKFRVSVIKLNSCNYGFISSHLESGMRNRLNPIVGKQ